MRHRVTFTHDELREALTAFLKVHLPDVTPTEWVFTYGAEQVFYGVGESEGTWVAHITAECGK
jgi:hypothetical protein